MKTLRQAILEFDECNSNELFQSCLYFDNDLDMKYPDNLHLEDGEDRDHSSWDNGDEYIEYANGIPVFIMYDLHDDDAYQKEE
jgi:hypothetical protein